MASSDMVLIDRKELAQLKKAALRLKGLRNLCGYLQDGTNESVTISQDDATRNFHLKCGAQNWHASSLEALIDTACRPEPMPKDIMARMKKAQRLACGIAEDGDNAYPEPGEPVIGPEKRPRRRMR